LIKFGIGHLRCIPPCLILICSKKGVHPSLIGRSSIRGRFEIFCSLLSANLDGSPQYTALSYVWGDAAVTVPITCNDCKTEVRANLAAALRRLRQPSEWTLYWIDALCIYSYRTAMKRLGNLRLTPQFSEGFHFVSERKNSCSVLSKCMLHIPRSVLHSLPFSFRKGREAALIGHVTERRGSAGGSTPSTPSTRRAT
jgi:hypothetical protein